MEIILLLIALICLVIGYLMIDKSTDEAITTMGIILIVVGCSITASILFHNITKYLAYLLTN